MVRLSVSVLGELGVSKQEEMISSFESDKVRALFAYLIVEADRSHRRETLAGLLWPDYPEQVAHHNLSQALFNLRKVLGDHTADPPYLQITRYAVQFNRESDYSLDLERFNAGYSAWEKSRGQDFARLDEMAGVYRGEFLQGFNLKDSTEFEDWVQVQRLATHQRALEALSTLGNEYEKRGDFQAARHFCTRQLELDPWREEAHSQLMRLLALDGQRSAAIAQYETCRRILADELGVEPSPHTRELYEQIRLGKIKTNIEATTGISAARVPKLPLPLTPFLGRKKELADLDQMMADPHCRCITLVGAGGMGKTRLALEAAARNQSLFAHGAAFIPLVSAGSPEAAVSAIASGTGFAFHGPAATKTQLLNYLRHKQMLLVLDNLEHLLVERPEQDSFTDLILEILQEAAQLKLLATSREALNLEEEWIYEVQGLDYPEAGNAEGADLSSSVALFIQHARRVRPGFKIEAGSLPGSNQSVARLCRLVEGMPLAIELAAAWVRILSPEEIVAEVERSLDFLSSSMRGIPERHRSIRAVFDQSWQMLSLEEQQVLGRLSTFRGGFTRHAAEQVAGASLLALSSLTIRSLVRRTETGRYDLHELIRQYAASKLAEDSTEKHRVQELHSVYYLGLLEEKDSPLHGHQQKSALRELSEEIHNLREAWDWASHNQKTGSLYRASVTLWYLFELRNWFQEGEQVFRTATESLRTGPPSGQDDLDLEIARAALLAHCGCFMFRQGKSEAAYAVLVPVVERLRAGLTSIGADPIAMIYSLGYLGVVCLHLGKFSEAAGWLKEGLQFAQASGQRWYEALLYEDLGVVASEQGEYAQAKRNLSQALAMFRHSGDPSFTAHTLSYLGRTLLALGEYQEAEGLLQESLEFARDIDYRFASGLALDGLGQAAYAQGKYPEAQSFFSESANLFEDMGDSQRLARTLNHQGMAALELNQTVEAQNAFRAALRLAQEGGLTPVVLSAAAGLAAIQVRQRSDQQVLELVLFILQHPFANQKTKDLARRLQNELETNLPFDAVEAAYHSAGEKNLDALNQWIP